MKTKKEKVVFKTSELEIVCIEDIRNDLKHLKSYIFKDLKTNEQVFIHYNYLSHILKVLNENQKTSRFKGFDI